MQERLSVVVSYYKSPHNLRVILEALCCQSEGDFEVWVSEDDANAETGPLLASWASHLPFPIHHLHQEADLGFRKNQMLNRCLQATECRQVAFLDGDCVPHQHWVRSYMKALRPGIFGAGRSVMLGPTVSERLRQHPAEARNLRWWHLLASGSTHIKEGVYLPGMALGPKNRGLVGRNWGAWKNDLIAVNGFDEDYQHAGVGEDVDVEWRLLANGCSRLSMKQKALVFHLYHPRTYAEADVQRNYQMMRQKQDEKRVVCLNGIRKE
jgi:glycosyltransferase involved in cell wall biosynthesis